MIRSTHQMPMQTATAAMQGHATPGPTAMGRGVHTC
jgi:hypothetical protein